MALKALKIKSFSTDDLLKTKRVKLEKEIQTWDKFSLNNKINKKEGKEYEKEVWMPDITSLTLRVSQLMEVKVVCLHGLYKGKSNLKLIMNFAQMF